MKIFKYIWEVSLFACVYHYFISEFVCSGHIILKIIGIICMIGCFIYQGFKEIIDEEK